MKEPHFLTLTVRNIPQEKLKSEIEKMYKGFRTVQKRLNKHKIKIVGIRKFECTYNEEKDTYHPHYHFIVETLEHAEILLEKWLDMFPKDTDHKGQDIKKCDEGSIMELFKYFTKLMPTKKEGQERRVIRVGALDNMFTAMQGKRVFQAFGIKASKEIDNEEVVNLESQVYKDLEESFGSWIWKGNDWVNLQELHDTGEIINLTGYEPAEKLKNMLKNVRK
jgi:hypothetical protein